MKKQKGAALIVVMSLLAVSLMIGLMSMQSSQVDERLAGNYKAAAEAQMNAERAAAEAVLMRGQLGFDSNSWGSDTVEDWKYSVRNFSYKDVVGSYDPEEACPGESYNRCLFFPMAVEVGSSSIESYVVAFGAVVQEDDAVIAFSDPVFLKYEPGVGNVDGFLDRLAEASIDVFSTFVDKSLSTSGNASAKEWGGLIYNIGFSSLFDGGESFFSFLDALRNDGRVNYFEDFPNSKKLGDYTGSIVVVENDFHWSGSQGDFEGVLILLGKGAAQGAGEYGFNYSGGGNSSFRGGVLHIPYEGENPDDLIFLKPKIRVSGGSGDLDFDASVIE